MDAEKKKLIFIIFYMWFLALISFGAMTYAFYATTGMWEVWLVGAVMIIIILIYDMMPFFDNDERIRKITYKNIIITGALFLLQVLLFTGMLSWYFLYAYSGSDDIIPKGKWCGVETLYYDNTSTVISTPCPVGVTRCIRSSWYIKTDITKAVIYTTTVDEKKYFVVPDS